MGFGGPGADPGWMSLYFRQILSPFANPGSAKAGYSESLPQVQH